MIDNRRWNESVRELSRHFPPGGPQLSILVHAFGRDRSAGDLMVMLSRLRSDLRIVPDFGFAADNLDAIVCYNLLGTSEKQRDKFLLDSLTGLRPGGRLLCLDQAAPGTILNLLNRPISPTLESVASMLSDCGFARVLAERIADKYVILSRGEKPYANVSAASIASPGTLERITQIASHEDVADSLQAIEAANLEGLSRGRYVFILVRQFPDKPSWAIQAGDEIVWKAQMVSNKAEQDRPYLLVFSSRPKAVAFMQQAVLAGLLREVNKVARYDKTIVAQWSTDILFNPAFSALEATPTFAFDGVQLTVDPRSAASNEE